MSFSLKLDPLFYDFRISDGKFVLVRGSDTVRDRIEIILNTQKGEWFLNVDDGVDYYGDDGILSQQKPAEEISAIIRLAILSDPDVIQIDDFQIIQNPNVKREFNISVDCQVKTTDFDTTGATQTITVEA